MKLEIEIDEEQEKELEKGAVLARARDMLDEGGIVVDDVETRLYELLSDMGLEVDVLAAYRAKVEKGAQG